MPVHQRGQKGFTLVELIVVLAILAILTTMAMTSTSGIVDQSRFEETINVLNNIEDAIFGRLHGDGPAYGYMTDLGDFPITVHENGINDLVVIRDYGKDKFIHSQSFMPDADYSDIKLISGWNGPYLHPAYNKDSIIKDGWGNPIIMGCDYKTPDIIERGYIRSVGPDGVDNLGSPISDDLQREYYGPTDIYGTVIVKIHRPKDTKFSKVRVIVYEPKTHFPYFGKFAPQNWSLIYTSSDETFPISKVDPNPTTYTYDMNIHGITYGYRVVQCSVGNKGDTDYQAYYQIVHVVAGGIAKPVEFNLIENTPP